MSSPKDDFECPTCDARPGSPCKRPSGRRVFGGGFHVARERRAEPAQRIAREPWPDGWPTIWRASVEPEGATCPRCSEQVQALAGGGQPSYAYCRSCLWWSKVLP